jgi:hypothetical protein
MKKTVLFIAAIAAMLMLGSCIIIPYNEIAVEGSNFESPFKMLARRRQ